MATYSEQYRQQHPLPSAPHQAQYQQDQHYQDQHQDQDRYQDQYQSQQSQSQSQYQQPQQFQQPQRQQQQSYPPTTQQQRPPQRPHHSSNKSRTFSFHSQKSHKSSGSKDLVETSAEKDAKRLHSKADPSLAINEAEPCTYSLPNSCPGKWMNELTRNSRRRHHDRGVTLAFAIYTAQR